MKTSRSSLHQIEKGSATPQHPFKEKVLCCASLREEAQQHNRGGVAPVALVALSGDEPGPLARYRQVEARHLANYPTACPACASGEVAPTFDGDAFDCACCGLVFEAPKEMTRSDGRA